MSKTPHFPSLHTQDFTFRKYLLSATSSLSPVVIGQLVFFFVIGHLELSVIVVQMARPCSMIGDIKTLKQCLRLAFRITRLWYVENSAYTPAIEMVFMDAKGDKINATIRDKELYRKWKPILKEGQCYEMQNFVVQRADGHFRSSPHPFKLNFGNGTIVKQIDLPEVPPNIYRFISFDEILSGKASKDILVDVIGQVIDKGKYYPGATRKKVVVTLKDQFGKILGCTLWEAYAEKMVNFMDNNHSGGPIVIILTLAKIHEAIDNYPLTLSNSKWGSTLLINENVKEIQQFKSSLDPTDVNELGSSQVMSQVMSQSFGSSQYTDHDRFFYKADVMSISDIINLSQDTQCCTVATIETVLTANGWSYEHCIKCNKNAHTCGCRDANPRVETRFRVEVLVSHKGDSAKFVLWDNECKDLLEKKAVDLRNAMIADGELDPMSVPQLVDSLEGKTLAFKIKVQPSFRRSSVVSVKEDEAIIEEVLKKMPTDKEPCTNDKGKSVCSVEKDEHICESQSLSATADFDPELKCDLTPAKRVSDDVQFEEIPTQDLASTQLSSTKLAKHIKTE